MALSTTEAIKIVLKEMEELLLEKNRKYGDSVCEPKRIFSKSSPEEMLYVRVDDKLSRIANRQNDDDEDPITDIIGYLTLLKVIRLKNKTNGEKSC